MGKWAPGLQVKEEKWEWLLEEEKEIGGSVGVAGEEVMGVASPIALDASSVKRNIEWN